MSSCYSISACRIKSKASAGSGAFIVWVWRRGLVCDGNRSAPAPFALKVKGVGKTFQSQPQSQLSQASNLQSGDYIFSLTATASDGKSQQSQLKVSLSPPPPAQIAVSATASQPLYGASGLLSPVRLAATARLGGEDALRRILGYKQYELKDHLGNVRVVISDEKTNTGEATLQSYANYYPFGMSLPGGHWELGAYRYGFNGKENDLETHTQDYGERDYSTLIGRFWRVDRITGEYASLTPYQFASNSPIAGVDRDGLEFEPYWATDIVEKNNRYKSDLYKQDPKNAEKIIRQHNINAFLFVGGALTAGFGAAYSGILRSFLWSSAATVATNQTVISISTSGSIIAANYGADIANFVYGAFTDDPNEPFPSNSGGQFADAGVGFKQAFTKGNAILDFFGGSASKYKNGNTTGHLILGLKSEFSSFVLFQETA
jgi:RHS repeat-associated protein